LKSFIAVFFPRPDDRGFLDALEYVAARESFLPVFEGKSLLKKNPPATAEEALILVDRAPNADSPGAARHFRSGIFSP
jgi:hypothetical protein